MTLKNLKQKILSFLLIFVLFLGNIIFPSSFKQPLMAMQIAPYQKVFIDTLAPTAMQLGQQYRLFPSVMIAQAILESDWGRSGLAISPYYNLFGIKSPSKDSGVIFDTQEDDGSGNLYWIKDSFRRYNSINESMVDYAKLFTSTPFLERHYAAFLNAATVQEATSALTGTYATDTRYGKSLMSIIVAYNLLQYDANIGRGPSWQLQETNDVVYVTHDEVNVRSNHSTDNQPIGRVHTNTKLFRLGTLTGWSKIRLADNRIVYIATQYLSSSPVPGKPVIEAFIKVSDNSVAEKEDSGDKDSSLANNNEPTINIDNLLDGNANSTNKPSAAPEPESTETEPNLLGLSEAELEAAKETADAAIANQGNNPSVAPKTGVIDVRTVNEKNKNNVNKANLENLLSSNVDLPFVSDTVKQEYAKKLQQARALYYNPNSTQEQIDAIIKDLKEIKGKADDESVEGIKKDFTEKREASENIFQTKIEYTKEAIREDKLKLEVKATRKLHMDSSSLKSLQAIGEKYIQYQLKAKTDLEQEPRIADKIMIHLKIPEDMNPDNIQVYRFADDWTLHEVLFEVDKNKQEVRLQNKQLGRYIIIEKNKKNNLIYQLDDAVSATDIDTKDNQYPVHYLGNVFVLLIFCLLLVRFVYKIFKQSRERL